MDKNYNENFYKSIIPNIDDIKNHLKKLNTSSNLYTKADVINYRLSESFLEKEGKFAESLANDLIIDKRIIDTITNWQNLNIEERKSFAKYLVDGLDRQLNTRTKLKFDDRKYLTGEFNPKDDSITISSDLENVKAPLGLISLIIHEHTGHVRQKHSNFGLNFSEDVKILKLQVYGYYIKPEKDYLLYYDQPAEVHARHLQTVFCEEFKKAAEIHSGLNLPDIIALQQNQQDDLKNAEMLNLLDKNQVINHYKNNINKSIPKEFITHIDKKILFNNKNISLN